MIRRKKTESEKNQTGEKILDVEGRDIASVYELYSEKVMHYIRGKISDPYIAQDLHSHVFLKVCQNMEGFDSDKASLSTWIFTITRNTVTDYFRTARQSAELDDSLPDFQDCFEKLEAASLLEELAEALEKLSERERNILILHYYSEIPLNKIADRMGMSYVTVRKSHKTALQKLRRLMENKI